MLVVRRVTHAFGSICNRTLAFSVVFMALAFIALTPIISVTSVTKAAPGNNFSPPRHPTQPTELIIIGTRHSAQLEYEDHAPARMRALLNRINPAAVGVETTPAWFAEGVFYEIAYESYGVAVPWAREKGKEVRAVDWQAGTVEFVNALSWPNTGALKVSAALTEARGQDQPDGHGDSHHAGGDPSALAESGQAAQHVPLELWDMRKLLFADTPEWRDAVHREYAYAAPHPNPWNEATRRYMLYRNVMIAREIVNLAADYDGRRIVVLIGAAHKPDLDLFLESVPNVVVRHASEWWGDGLTEDEVAAEERRPDHLAILWYNLAGSRVPSADVDLDRMDALLDKLEAEGGFDPEVRFLRARWHAISGQPDQALEIYRFLAWETKWDDRPFTYPDRDLTRRMIEWNARDAERLGFPGQSELGLGNVISPVANLTIRQRVLYELALQTEDEHARRRARLELQRARFNSRQRVELQALLEID